METIIAYCGLNCESCLIHLATLEQDKTRQKTMRELIAEECFKLYGMNLQPEDINDCDECRASTDNRFSGSMNCEIRKCASGKNIDSCAYCNGYACEILKKHFLLDPGAQTRLEEIRQSIKYK